MDFLIDNLVAMFKNSRSSELCRFIFRLQNSPKKNISFGKGQNCPLKTIKTI